MIDGAEASQSVQAGAMPRITAEDLLVVGHPAIGFPAGAEANGAALSQRMSEMRRVGRVTTTQSLFPERMHGAVGMDGNSMWGFVYSSGAWQGALVELISLTRTTRTEELIVNGRTTHIGVSLTKRVLVMRDGAAFVEKSYNEGASDLDAAEQECYRVAARTVTARLWKTKGC